MTDVTQILSAIESGNPRAADQLLPLVYAELRRLAAQKLAREKPGQTLQATALVHEAYLRLVGGENDSPWNSRGHFFAAAAEAMRRILVEISRRKQGPKQGGDRRRVDLDDVVPTVSLPSDDLLAVNDALERLEMTDRPAADLVKLRYFAGFTVDEAAEILGISSRSANYVWEYARAWLLQEIDPS